MLPGLYSLGLLSMGVSAPASGAVHELQGAPTVQATATGALTTEVRLAAAAQAIATAQGHINAVLQAAAAGQVSASGNLEGTALQALAQAQSLAQATLTGIAAALQGVAAGQVTATAEFGSRIFRFPLAYADRSPAANLSGLWWAWFPSITALRNAAVAAGGAAGTGATTGPTGVFSVPAPANLSVGEDQGFGLISEEDNTPDDASRSWVNAFDVE